MKERFLQVLKWFFIILGVIFFLQFLLIIGAILGIAGFANYDIKPFEAKNNNIKPFNNIVKYLDEYKEENGEYPSDIKDIEDSDILKEINNNKNYDFEYKTSNDDNCYTITAKPKEKSKKNLTTKEYGKCSSKTNGANSHSESYVEYSSIK